MNPASDEVASGLEAADPKVGWIYKLNKDTLAKELRKFKLETGGTVEEMRRRLTKFLRNGPPTDPPLIPDLPMPIQPTQTVNRTPFNFDLLNQLRKLNIVFDGKTDPISFIERLGQVQDEYGISDAHLLKTLPGLLQGKAQQWYMNYKQRWTTSTEFTQDFQTFFYPPDYQDNLEEMINAKRQGKHETARNFILELQTLIRRRGTYTAEQEVTCIYKRLRPECRQYIRRTDVETMSDLLHQTYEFEQLQKEVETENKSKRVTEPIRTAGILSSRSPTDVRPVYTPNSVNHTRTQQPQAPATDIICWKCGDTGHTRFRCRGPARLFCSRCGREGVQSRHCRCNRTHEQSQGNAAGAGSLRGNSSTGQ